MALGVATARCDETIVFSDAVAAPKTAPEALWQVGSLTKMYVAATVLRLAEERKLTIEDSLADYLSDFPDAENITLLQLLNHTSGVFDYLQTDAAVAALNADPGRDVSNEELIAFATEHGPAFSPGTSWGYSNTDYILLGRVVEEATGAQLGELVRTRALDPAELTHSFLASVERPVGELVPGFQAGQDLTDVVNPKWWGAAGAMQATPGDVLEWARRLYATTDVIGDASVAQMLTTVPTDHSKYRYGLGTVEWDASTTHGNGPAYGHFGSLPGYQCEVLYHPENQLTITALVSDSDGKPHALVLSAYEAFASLQATPGERR